MPRLPGTPPGIPALASREAERLAMARLSAAVAEYEVDAGRITDEDIAAARAHTAWQPASPLTK